MLREVSYCAAMRSTSREQSPAPSRSKLRTAGRVVGRAVSWLVIGGAVAVAVVLAMRAWTYLRARDRVFQDPAQVTTTSTTLPVAIVFGAGVRGDNPSAMLYDRVARAAELYKLGKVRTLLMSGDNRFVNYNEPGVMRNVALQLGVPDDAIVLDLAGRSTYETCYRARDIFGVQSAVLVTQDFHLDRALFTCNTLGIDAVGLVADRRPYRALTYCHLREIAATANAFLELYITRPLPVLGEVMPIEAD